MKKVIILSLIAISLLCGCDSGLRIVDMEIEEYPDKIVYLSGVDSELDLSGGAVSLILKQKTRSTVEMNSENINISHNIDFNKPGVYVVELERADIVLKFPIQVIDVNYIER